MSSKRMALAALVAVLIGVAVWWISGAVRSSKPTAATSTNAGGSRTGKAGDSPAGVWHAPSNADLDPDKADPTGDLRLEGQVIDAAQQGVGGATVVISSSPVRIATSETDGSFAFDGLLARTYRIGAVKDGDRAEGLSVRLRADTEPVILRMHAGTTLAVTVIDRDTQSPIAGATVTVATLLEQSAVTDAAGVAELRGMGSWFQYVDVAAAGYAPGGSGFEIPDDPGGRFEHTVELSRGAPVRGVVRTPDGKGQPEAWVYGSTTAGDGSLRTQADADGAWSFPAVSAGEWVFTSPGERFAPGDSGPIAVDGKTEVDGVVIQVVAGYSILGVVVDEAGQPVPTARVSYYERSTGGGGVTADAHGAFDIFGLPPGKYELAASDGDRASKPTVAEVTATNATGVTLTVAEASIRGTVVDSVGEPVAEASVRAMADSGYSSLDDNDAITDSSGRFTLGPLTSDSYRISADWPDSGRENTYVRQDAATAKPGDHDVKIVLSAAATIRGKVARGGAPVTRFAIGVTEGGHGMSGFETPKIFARADGSFERAGLPPGTYSVTIGGADFATEEIGEVAVKAGEVKDLGTIEVDGGRTVTGIVVDAMDAPVAGATVAVAMFFMPRDGGIGLDGDPMKNALMNAHQARTGDDGRFEVRGIATDARRPLQVLADKRGVGRSRQIALPAGEAELTIRLEATGAIAVTVTGGGDDASVRAQLIDGETEAHGYRGAGGISRLDGLVPGTYRVTAMTYQPMRNTPPVEVTVTSGQTADVTVAFPTNGVTVVIEPRGECSYLLLGRPGAGANPENFDPSDMVASSPCEDKTPVELDDIAPGDYEVCGGATKFECTPITVQASPQRQTFKVP